ncbi:FHIPEP family type III secretion protein [Pseudonocardia charpentierae]|uniref:FHIPEP family type III secretion protein n=1 Tax=Pseudonocardia charpentierae TaxID=3075545 RepID=A0ABU2NIP3_9PSEU|nr:FHIPEP family type III secretion protein [Pseudonocardia sp. DSM 45834]MDT0353611.1 FHIPEP family type III secretion protein [Pseudonocardia sp. DSM 45834]
MPVRPNALDLARDEDQRLSSLLISAYAGVEGVPRLGLLAQSIGLPTQSINFGQPLDLVLPSLLQAAAANGRMHDIIRAAAERNPAYNTELLALLPAEGPRDRRPLNAVLPALELAGRPRSPIIIAVESKAEPLDDADLLKVERHLTVSLSTAQLDAIDRITAEVLGPDADLAPGVTDVAEIIDAGFQVWTELVGAESRLKGLLTRIADARLAQPVAWCGRSDVLARLQAGLLIAHTTGEQAVEDFISVGAGHFFMPVDIGKERSMRPRPPGTMVSVRVLDPRRSSGVDLSDLAQQPDVVIITDVGKEVTGSLTKLAETVGQLPADAPRAVRAVLGVGAGPADAQLVAQVLRTLPFLSVAPATLAQPDVVVGVLKRALMRLAGGRALPCVVAAVRDACIREATDSADPAATLAALMWSTWSWVGLPLFPVGYEELLPAAYPHLMNLRTVAADGWFFNRSEGILDDYAARRLSHEVQADRVFHLYLSGAGGTGKSCFLRNVAERMQSRSTIIPVWYRVDAPSLLWHTIEERVREETLAAVAHSPFGPDIAQELKQLPSGQSLGSFLKQTVRRLRAADPAFVEIAVFIDQLERTFESGDEPNPARLDTIAGKVRELLEMVGIDQGVRIFIASRKQYLPDFLRSTRTARNVHLEFNVLQTIDAQGERLEFVQQVVDWCKGEELVNQSLALTEKAKARLADNVKGHPLEMMLSLIHVLSARPEGTVDVSDLEQLRPWENLFALDLKAAGRDDLDWHFVLAMAHSRTEIVRFEEVWWRLRMVDSQLTRRIEELTPKGILERLWLFGLLGRTLYARPYGGDPARYVEFFHANLRDHLLRNVMARGGSDTDIRRRRTGTPPAWRALDRLTGYARDWEQTQQLLPAEDVRVLIEHRDAVIEQITLPGEKPFRPFQLLFLRESSNEVRGGLIDAAMDCFAFSALVHNDRGRDTFATLFPDVDKRVEQCRVWIDRCVAENRPAVLAYLVETETTSARRLLTELVLDGTGTAAAAAVQETAALLTEPLYAGDFRDQIVAHLLRTGLDRVQGDVTALPDAVAEFVVGASGGERDALLRVLDYGVSRLATDADPRMRDRAITLGPREIVDDWLRRKPELVRYSGVRTVRRAELPGGAVLGLVVGSTLRPVVDDARLADWSKGLRRRLGVPLPDLRAITGECEDEELELRSPRARLATNVFRVGEVRVDARRWADFARTSPGTVLDSYDLVGEHKVLWLPKDVVARAKYPFRAWEFDEAVTDWLEETCREAFELLMDQDLFNRTVSDWDVVSVLRTRPALGSNWNSQLRRVIVDLVEDGVPLEPPHGPSPTTVVEHLAWLAEMQPPENVAGAVREFLQPWICRAVADESGQVTALVLDEQLEDMLLKSIRSVSGRRILALGQRDASQLVGGVRRAVERLLAEAGRPPLVLVTDQAVRLALAKLLRRFDIRIPVLSYAELDPDNLIALPGGLVSRSAEAGGT